MDDKTLIALANKLGTTTEYLFQALVKQAPISAGVDILLVVCWAVIPYYLLKYLALPRMLETDWEEEATFIYWRLWIAAEAIALFVFTSNLTEIVTGLFNPEYWALHQIIK